MKILRGPAAVNGELCHCTKRISVCAPLSITWEGLDRVMTREPEDLHEMKKESDG